MLTEETTPNIQVQVDPSVKQAFLRSVADTSLVHKSTVFKDTSVHIENSVIGKNVTLGSNVKIKNCVILQSVIILDDV